MTQEESQENKNTNEENMPLSEGQGGILDTVITSHKSAALRTFDPRGLILDLLKKLPSRSSQVLELRYGLVDGKPQTLEQIGARLNLTRERIRQIEKESIKKLEGFSVPSQLDQGIDLVHQIIEEHGNIIREDRILETLVPEADPLQKQAILFLPNFVPRFGIQKETRRFHTSWYVSGFDPEFLKSVVLDVVEYMTKQGKPISSTDILDSLKQNSAQTEIANLRLEALESMMDVSKKIDSNPFNEWGLTGWDEINPKDVGDKAFLVLKHHNDPEHYSEITDLINKQHFDTRTAHKETVHNELIKDKRFVLIGRGVYALKEWGYKPGVVADIIENVIRKAGEPLTKDQIIAEVLKQRMVKKNTVIVGLSNKSRFQKTSDNKYTIVNV